MSGTPVTDFYKGKNVFITGVTGFVSKGIVEKLLRSCDVGTIYLLIRSKRDKDAKSRLEEVKKSLVFEKVKAEKDEFVFDKLVAVAGDVGEENLGLSEGDRKVLTENVDIVIHSAATLDFELNLKYVVNINLLGTQRIVKFCSQMKRLQALVHVSTAYSNSNRDQADEVLYPLPASKEEIISVMNKTNEDAAALESEIIRDHPNSYTISKAYAEHEVYDSNLPSAIVRPSMIVGAWREPDPGWTESKNGPTGFFMGASKGVIRRLPINKDLVYDYIPVDMVVNEVILAAWHVAAFTPAQTAIFHCTTSTYRPFSYSPFEGKINEYLSEYPLLSAVWYPHLRLISNFTLFRISSIFLHFLPGFFFDLLLKLSGKKPMLVRLHAKVDSSLCRLAPFIFREWFFDNTNTLKLFQSLSPQDQKIFNIDVKNLNYEEYFKNAVLGVRRYLNKEELKTLPAARKKHFVLSILNVLVQVLVLWLFCWTAASVTGSSMISSLWALPVGYLFICAL